MSDAIVLWRMRVVWNKARSVTVLAAALLATTVALNLANIIVVARMGSTKDIVGNDNNESGPIYDGSAVGLVAAFVSLASNFCATIIVGIRAWYLINTSVFT